MTKAQHWQAIVQQWRDSGLTQKQFCAEQNIKLCTFQYWINKQRLENKPDSDSVGFAPVVLTSDSSSQIELHLGSVMLKLDLDLLPDVLIQLKQAGWLHAAT